MELEIEGLYHKGIRYIEWYRDYLMTIRRHLFCSAAYFCKRTLTYLPPLPYSGPGLPTWGNPHADQWPGVEGKHHEILLCDWI